MAPRNDPPPPDPPTKPRLFSRLSHASKRSFRSHSSSFEADDERSTESDDDMSPHRSSSSGAARSVRRYPGEDTRRTCPAAHYLRCLLSLGASHMLTLLVVVAISSRELRGWYMYAFAAETFAVCGTLFPSAAVRRWYCLLTKLRSYGYVLVYPNERLDQSFASLDPIRMHQPTLSLHGPQCSVEVEYLTFSRLIHPHPLGKSCPRKRHSD